jgi:hypothetical protein
VEVDDVLPSVRLQPDDPRPVGFIDDLTDDHVAASAAALAELSQAFPSTSGGHLTKLSVCLCSARYVPALPFVLFSFHLVELDDQGELVDEVPAGLEVRYAFVINHAVEVQREAALLFLYEFVFRQVALRQLAESDNAVHSADAITARSDAEARLEFRDRLRQGWRSAVKALVARANHDNVAVHVRYQLDPFPERIDVVRRMPALRATYNSIDLAREYIDKTVSLVAGHDPRVRAPGAPEEVRSFVERRLIEMGMRHYTTQTLRDAEVCGNGYFVSPTSPTGSPYNLRPEEVETLNDGSFLLHHGDSSERLDAPVLHARGVEQFQSPYGYSVLEVLLPIWATLKRFQEIEDATQPLLERFPPGSSQHQYLQATLDLIGRERERTDERIGKLLWFPRDWIEAAASGLYFPGQERM